MAKLADYFERKGQSIWCDYLRRSFITSGELQTLIDQGLRGVTSNPTIFERAISGSVDYDEELRQLVAKDETPEQIFETLVLDDIAKAADVFRPLYDSTDGSDGFVSVEVNPRLANDTQGMIAEARRFYYKLSRPNVMVKIPATEAGIPAVSTLIGEGININITLIFSLAQYEATARAYMAGLEKLTSSGGDPKKVSSVASFFVSRVDTAVDRELDKRGETGLQGKIAIANAKVAYARFRELFSEARWKRLKEKGARVQRPLWASTSTKNPAYPDTMYVDSLVGPDTVDTLPPATIRAAVDHGRLEKNALSDGLEQAREDLARLSRLGIRLDSITDKLEDEGVSAFAKSFDAVLSSITKKREQLLAELHHESAHLGEYGSIIESSLRTLVDQRVIHRIWAHDYTLWKPEPTEISNRMDWLHAPEIMQENISRIDGLTQSIQSAGYSRIVLLGMGGSSLAPYVFSKTFGDRDSETDRRTDMFVLDSVDPAAVMAVDENLDPKRTLFIVSSKSGTTIETISLMKYFYGRMAKALGQESAGEHFIAITDPSSPLVSIAKRSAFRGVILNDPNIGGRYSALSYDGLVPAGLIGVDIPKLLGQALNAAAACEPYVDLKNNPGAYLGSILGELAKRGRDKVTIVASPRIRSFGDWAEQLIAESTGKEGKGILPVVGEQLSRPEAYGTDRLFVSMSLEHEGDEIDLIALSNLETAGHPVVYIRLHDIYELGRQFFLWEMAVAVAGQILRINPFDQPNVESSKALARAMIEQFKEKGRLPKLRPKLATKEMNIYGEVRGDSPESLVSNFLAGAGPGSYIAIQAYLRQTGKTDGALLELRELLKTRYKAATTLGYGPRFLHSTGQLHKGDAGRGFFLQVTAEDNADVPIPDDMGSQSSQVSFGVLKEAQVLGDRQALIGAGRKVLRIHLKKGDVVGAIHRLTEALHDLTIPVR